MRQNLISICAVALAISVPRQGRHSIFAPTSYATPRALSLMATSTASAFETACGRWRSKRCAAAATPRKQRPPRQLKRQTSANLGTARFTPAAVHKHAGSLSFAELGDTLYFNNTSGVVGWACALRWTGRSHSGRQLLSRRVWQPDLIGPGIQVGAFGAPVTSRATSVPVFNKDGMYEAEHHDPGPPTTAATTTARPSRRHGRLRATTLYLPTGLSTLGVRTQLSLTAAWAVCDFSNTGVLSSALWPRPQLHLGVGRLHVDIVAPPTGGGAVPNGDLGHDDRRLRYGRRSARRTQDRDVRLISFTRRSARSAPQGADVCSGPATAQVFGFTEVCSVAPAPLALVKSADAWPVWGCLNSGRLLSSTPRPPWR